MARTTYWGRLEALVLQSKIRYVGTGVQDTGKTESQIKEKGLTVVKVRLERKSQEVVDAKDRAKKAEKIAALAKKAQQIVLAAQSKLQARIKELELKAPTLTKPVTKAPTNISSWNGIAMHAAVSGGKLY